MDGLYRLCRVGSIVLGSASVAASVAIGAWLRWGHIDMTQRRLLVEFPLQNLAAAACLVVGMVMLHLGGVDLGKK